MPSASTRRHLPIPLTDLIGRAREIEEVTGWLGRCRLVTLLGTGGAGKTRLAIAAAEAALPRFAAGVWFVDLAPLSSPALVAEATAKALGIGDEAGRSPEERLTEALASSSLLLVLDNCEHVLDACAVLASYLLSACPGLRVLTTSRQALGVPGEQVYAVPSLRLPPLEHFGPEADPAHAEKNVLGLLEYEAVRLFVERATQASPAFRLTRRNAEAVVEICHRLDGIPAGPGTGGGARPVAVSRRDLRAPGRPLPPVGGGEPGRRPTSPDAAGGDGLELRPADRPRTFGAASPERVHGRVAPGGG